MLAIWIKLATHQQQGILYIGYHIYWLDYPQSVLKLFKLLIAIKYSSLPYIINMLAPTCTILWLSVGTQWERLKNIKMGFFGKFSTKSSKTELNSELVWKLFLFRITPYFHWFLIFQVPVQLPGNLLFGDHFFPSGLTMVIIIILIHRSGSSAKAPQRNTHKPQSVQQNRKMNWRHKGTVVKCKMELPGRANKYSTRVNHQITII